VVGPAAILYTRAVSAPRFRDRAFLEAALLRELSATWGELSRDLFKNALRPPVISLTDGVRRLGAWNRCDRTLSLSRELVFEQPWGVVREVLKHEIAHQYVDEFLRIHDQTAHGPAFARVCRERAIDVSATGMPAADETEQHPMLRRIMRLLALAESPNLHEAEAAMNEARRLMLLHNIDASASAEKDGFRFRHVGPVKARTEGSERILAGILGQHFFVSVIWVQVYMPFEARMGQVLEICGTPANLDVAEYVHGFLTETALRLWREHKRAQGIISDRDRRSFAVGVMAGFLEKLDQAEQESHGQSNALVRHADAERDAYMRRRYPRTRSRSTGSTVAPEAYERGREAGRKVEVRRPVTDGVGVRMLPPIRP
jgi:hypothetical protein